MNEVANMIKAHVEGKYNELNLENEKRKAKSIELSLFVKELKKQDTLPLEFDDTLFHHVVDKCLVTKDGYVEFKIKDGSEIKLEI